MEFMMPLLLFPSLPLTTPIMTVREVTGFLRLTETTVYNLLQKLTLPGKKISGQWHISQIALTQWLESYTTVDKTLSPHGYFLLHLPL